jgi:nucleotide-binding universal stress UspA family protein
MKNVLLLVHDDEGQEARLQGALDATRSLEGHLTCIHVTEFAPIVGDAYGMSGAVMLLDLQRETEEKNRVTIEKRLAIEGVPYDFIEVTSTIEPAMAVAAELADLIVVNEETRMITNPHLRHLVERMVIKSGKPLLAMPNENGFQPADPVLVAWDGSDPASAALRAAIPLLQMSDSVTVYEIDDGSDGRSIEEAAEYLSRHGIKADVIRDKVVDSDFVEPLLLEKLESGRFGWAVMGAFSKSRLRETLFGGTTKRMLKESPIPMLIAH